MNNETQTETQYMLLFRGTDWHKGLSLEEMQEVVGQWTAWFKKLNEQGIAKAGQPLAAQGKIVSGKHGRMVADGPFAESKEAIGGYFLLQVNTLEEAVAIAKEEHIDPTSVDCIDVRIGELLGPALCEPAALKFRPPTAYAAKFSMPYVVATALIHGEVTSAHFTAPAIADPQVLGLADKVRYAFDPIYDEGTALRGWVQLRQEDGRVFVRSTLASRGTPENPWAFDDVAGKFLRNATPIIGSDRAAKLVDLTPALARLDKAGALARLCHGEDA